MPEVDDAEERVHDVLPDKARGVVRVPRAEPPAHEGQVAVSHVVVDDGFAHLPQVVGVFLSAVEQQCMVHEGVDPRAHRQVRAGTRVEGVTLDRRKLAPAGPALEAPVVDVPGDPQEVEQVLDPLAPRTVVVPHEPGDAVAHHNDVLLADRCDLRGPVRGPFQLRDAIDVGAPYEVHQRIASRVRQRRKEGRAGVTGLKRAGGRGPRLDVGVETVGLDDRGVLGDGGPRHGQRGHGEHRSRSQASGAWAIGLLH